MTRAAVYGSPAWRRWKHDHHWATDPLGEGNTALISALGGNAAVLGFYDARKNVTVSGSTVTQVDDVRGAVGFGPSLIGTGHAPAFDTVNLLASNPTGTEFLRTAASSIYDVSVPLTLVHIGSVPTTTSDFVTAVSNATNTQFNCIAKSSGGVIRNIRSGGGANLSVVAAGAALRCVISVTSGVAFACAVANAVVARNASSSLGAAGS